MNKRYRLSSVGLSDHRNMLLRSVLRMLAANQNAAWQWVDDSASADLVLVDGDDDFGRSLAAGQAKRRRLFVPVTQSAPRGAIWLKSSFKSQDLLDLFRLCEQRLAVAENEGDDLAFEDDQSQRSALPLAAALERAIQSSSPALIVGDEEGRLYLDAEAKKVLSNLSAQALETWIEGSGLYVSPARLPADADAWQAIHVEYVAWLVGRATNQAADQLPAATERFRLRRWPDGVATLLSDREMLMLSLLSGDAMSAQELSTIADADAASINLLLSCLRLCKLLIVEQTPSAPAPAAPAVRAPVETGWLQRLRKVLFQ